MKDRNVFEKAAHAIIADALAERPEQILREGMPRLAALVGRDSARIEAGCAMLAQARDKLVELTRAGDSLALRGALD
ncbi:MAG: hypothetical protein ABSB13_03345 [Candidatus Binatus sp.]|jgi:hypothetical protein|uniref:hypothetical protein n=1 Tax=Candidatus Binatus sp. TaxID=2811406 RepID=UPI003D0B2723